MPRKKWKYITTNYREAWLKYRKSGEYEALCDIMKRQGIRQPYSSNLLKSSFAAGWKATKTKIEIL